MKFHIITIFPNMIKPFVEEGVLGRAKNKKGVISVDFYDPRDFTADKHKTVDDRPFGGGPGMVLKALPLLKATESALSKFKVQSSKLKSRGKVKIIILSPRGKKFDNKMAGRFAKNHTDIVLISGRYEGMDARVRKILKDFSRAENSKQKTQSDVSVSEVSVGDYVLSGGELPAMIIVDAVARKIPEVLGNKESLEDSRHAPGEMYTRPENLLWKGKDYKVPKVLLTGHHKKIEEWRKGK
jgi:tRNA (guanine37-N1)-methyltransferase